MHSRLAKPLLIASITFSALTPGLGFAGSVLAEAIDGQTATSSFDTAAICPFEVRTRKSNITTYAFIPVNQVAKITEEDRIYDQWNIVKTDGTTVTGTIAPHLSSGMTGQTKKPWGNWSDKSNDAAWASALKAVVPDKSSSCVEYVGWTYEGPTTLLFGYRMRVTKSITFYEADDGADKALAKLQQGKPAALIAAKPAKYVECTSDQGRTFRTNLADMGESGTAFISKGSDGGSFYLGKGDGRFEKREVETRTFGGKIETRIIGYCRL